MEALDKAWQMQFAAMRRAIAEEMDAPEPEDAFSQGALAAYNHVLSFWPTAPVSGAAALPTSPPALDAGDVIAALTDEDEIAHGEAWDDVRKAGVGVCAYCDGDWPCRTQQGIDRLLARLAEQPKETTHD